MKKFARFTRASLLFIFLTATTQIGGLVYLLSKVGNRFVTKAKKGGWSLLAIFTCLYLLSTFFIVPPIAKSLGRIPLPISSKGLLVPNHLWTCLSNRHYVKPQLYDLVMKSAVDYNANEKSARPLRYLDANFPFINGFPLLPHRSHDDGEKIDLAFMYSNKSNNQAWAKRVSFTGYGFCEGPRSREENMPAHCAKKGYWQYSLLENIIGTASATKVQFDAEATRRVINKLSQQAAIKKIFIEPHLKARLEFSHDDKIRFHGCAAVRHDDHIHVEL